MKPSINLQLWGWIAAGLIGLLMFFLLRDSFDFMADAPVAFTKDTAIEMTTELFTNLGIENDTHGIVAFRNQRVSMYGSIEDSLKNETPSPSALNKSNFYLHGWELIAAQPLAINESFNLTPGSIYNSSGLYRVRWDNSGLLRLFELNTERGDLPVLLGENNRAFAAELAEEIFGHNLSEYEYYDPNEDEINGILSSGETSSDRIQLAESDESTNIYRWRKSSGFYDDFIEIELQSAVHREGPETDRTEIHGVSVIKFEAFNELEKLPADDPDQQFFVFFFLVIALLVIFVFIEGFSQIFKGKVDWNRILIVALIITVCIFGWRFIYLQNFSDLFNTQTIIVAQFNQLIFGLVMGLFSGVAYLGWEAYARSEKQYQISLLDAYWRGKFFLNETGTAILNGFSLTGILLGLTAIYLTLTGILFYQSDSQFGFSEILNKPFFLSLNMSVFVVAALCSVAIIGVVFHFFERRIRNNKISFTLAVLLGGALFAGLGRSFGTNGTVFEDIALFMILAVPLYSAYKLSGVVTVFSGLWLFASLTNIMPYIQSPSPDVAINAWLQISFAGSILLFGIAAYRYGPSITSVSSYIPDYEKKMIRSLRFENEMLIARKTQEKLMPLIHPETDEYELFGYFMPSFEVGGDYFDYVTGTGADNINHLTLTVVDVSGKSMRAAMHAVFTSGLLRSRMYTDQPSKILREITPVIHEKTDSQTFITCIVGRYRPDSKNLKLANAGHCLPILKRDGKAEFLQTPEPKYPLGVLVKVAYNDISIQLKKGDLVLFYSDGFPEAVNDKGERIGFDQALHFVKDLNTDELTAKEICNKIRDYIRQYSIERLADDTTILCLKIK